MKSFIKAITMLVIFSFFSFILPTPYVVSANTTSINAEVDLSSNPVNISVSENRVVLESNGCSAFIKVIATFDDNATIDVTTDAVMESENINIAGADGGRILARGKGKTVVTVSYGGLKTSICVLVLKTVDLVEEVKASQAQLDSSPGKKESIGVLSLSAPERTAINNKCLSMVSIWWTPVMALTGWKNRMTFQPGIYYCGIPYSQTYYQCDDISFRSALNYPTFYNAYSQNGVIMPKYGNDCSGFVSFAWGISRINTTKFIERIQNGTYPKVGNYNANSPSYNDLHDSYGYLQTGDAVVKSGHTFVIAVNFGTSQERFQCFEQTPYYSDITYWTYDYMAERGYMPFSRN